MSDFLAPGYLSTVPFRFENPGGGSDNNMVFGLFLDSSRGHRQVALVMNCVTVSNTNMIRPITSGEDLRDQ